MKNLTLIKISNRIELGHLYEHLYTDSIHAFLLAHNLFEGVDYYLEASSYHGGPIIIDLDLQTPNAITLIPQLPTLSIDTSENNLTLALRRLAAEKEQTLHYSSLNAVTEELHILHKSSWLQPDELNMINLTRLRRNRHPLWSTTQPARVRHMTATLYLENPAALYPLAYRMMQAVTYTAQNHLGVHCGVYNVRTNTATTRGTLRQQALYAAPHKHPITTTSLLDVYHTSFQQLQRSDKFADLLATLSNLSYSSNVWGAPGIATTFEATFHLVGKQGWSALATHGNSQTIVESLRIEVAQGHQRISKNLSDPDLSPLP